MTITEFLEARIAEDEAVAEHARSTGWFAEHNIQGRMMEGYGLLVAEYLVRLDPVRVLAECAAKRVFLGEWERVVKEHYRAYGVVPESPVIRAFASVYKDHPDYRQE